MQRNNTMHVPIAIQDNNSHDYCPDNDHNYSPDNGRDNGEPEARGSTINPGRRPR
ncbi:MAG: hypothetical protein K2G06_07745 [Muribaculaceae bacterium]|nr:hypothetical protein [Muribaculaceae bacterium]